LEREVVMSQWGIGAMIQMLSGNESAVNAYTSSLNKEIKSIKLDPDMNGGDGALVMMFTDDTGLMLYDCARSCCESRYMSTEDDLQYFVGSVFKSVDIRDGSVEEHEYGEESEMQFMQVNTNRGVFVINTYNHHNGYYGGIVITAKLVEE